MGASPGGAPGGRGGGSDITLTLTVDPTTGNIQVKGFKKVLEQLGMAVKGAGDDAETAGKKAKQSAGGWTELAAQTFLAGRAVSVYKALLRETIVNTTLLAARIEVLNTTLAVTATNMGFSTAAARAQVETVRAMNITHRNAIFTITQFIRAQLDLARATDLSRTAQDLAVIAGTNSSETLQTLITAIQNQRVIMLRQFGIVTTSIQIFNEYAAATGRAAASLTEVEKRQAFLSKILTEGAKITGSYEAAMEDAGKRLTSIPRLIEDVQEVVGKGFVPVFALAVDAVSSLLEFLKGVDSGFFAFAGTALIVIGAMGSLVLATQALTVAWVRLNAAMAATQTTGILGFISSIRLGWIAIAAAIIGAVVALQGYARELASGKAELEATLEAQTQLVQLQNLRTAQQDLVDQEQRIRDLKSGQVQFNEELLRSVSALGEEAGKELLLLREQRNLEDRRARAIQLARGISKELVLELEAAADGTARQVVNMERIGDLEDGLRKKEQEGIDNIRRRLELAEKELAARRDLARVESERVKRPQAASGLGGLAAGSQFRVLAEINAGVADQEKLVTGLRQRLEQVTGELNKQFTLQEVGIARVLESLAKTIDQRVKLNELARKGVSSSEAQERALSRETEEAVSLVRTAQQNLDNLQRRAAEEVKLGKNVQENLKNQELFRVQAAALLEIQMEIERIIREQGTGLEALLAINKQITRVSDEFVDSFINFGQDVDDRNKAVFNALENEIKLNESLRAEQARRLEFELAILDAELQFINTLEQTQEARLAQLAIEEEIAKKRLAAEAREKGIPRSQLNRRRELLELRFEEERRKIAQEANDRIRQDALKFQGELISILGASNEVKKMLILQEVEFEIEKARRTISNEEELRQKILQIRQASNAKILVNELQQAERIRDIQLETLKAQTSALESEFNRQDSIPTAAGLQALIDGLDRVAEKEKQNIRNSEQVRMLAMQDRIAAEEFVAAKIIDIDSRTAARRAQLEQEFRKEQERRALDEQRIRIEEQLAFNEITDLEADVRSDLLNLQSRLNELVRDGIIDEERRVRLLERQEQVLREQAEVERVRRGLDAGSRAADLFTGGGIGGGIGIETFKKIAEESARAREEAVLLRQETVRLFEEGNLPLDQFLSRMEALENRFLSLTQVIDLWAVGLGKVVSILDVANAATGILAEATAEAVGAFAEGGNAGEAFRQAVSGILKALAKEATVKAIFQTAEGIAALLNPFTSAKAAGHFKAAALYAAVATAAGFGARATAGGGAGGGGGARGGREEPNPVSTRTAIEDSIVRLNENIVAHGKVVAQSGDAYRDSVLAFAEQQRKQIDSPAIERSNQAVADKIDEISDTEQGRKNFETLLAIRDELRKSNEKELNIQINNDFSIDGAAAGKFFDGQVVRSVRNQRRRVNREVIEANAENSNRRETGRVLAGDGGV